jgi:hypothetical protein
LQLALVRGAGGIRRGRIFPRSGTLGRQLHVALVISSILSAQNYRPSGAGTTASFIAFFAAARLSMMIRLVLHALHSLLNVGRRSSSSSLRCGPSPGALGRQSGAAPR